MKSVWYLWISLIFLGCTRSEYKQLESGNSWKLVSFNEEEVWADSASLIFLDGYISVLNTKDTIDYFTNAPFEPGNDDLWTILKSRYEGDMIEYLSVTDDSFRPANRYGDTLRYVLRIDHIRTSNDLNDARIIELSMLDSLARSELIREKFSEIDGIFVNIEESGDTTAVLEGRELLMHYQGSTLDGSVFDDSRRMAGPFTFVYGNENQVIKGLEMTLSGMHKGDKGTVIIPSWYAFGSKGSAGGLVPPYSTVIYKVEVLEIGD